MRLSEYQFLFVVLVFNLLNHVYGDHYEDITEEFRKKITDDVLRKLSPDCANFYDWRNYNDKEFQAIFPILFDSSAKIPSGIASINMYDLGFFDECYNLTAPFQNQTVQGKYCLGTKEIDITIPAQKHMEIMGPTPRLLRRNNLEASNETVYKTYLRLAYCTPSFCTAEDLQQIMAMVLPIGIHFTETDCYSKDTEPDLSNGAITTIVVLSVFALIVVASTIYELALSYSKKKPAHEILLAFSALNNSNKILKSTSNPEQLLCLNGIRGISMMWVILGHEYSLFSSTPIVNSASISDFMSDKANMWLLNAPLSVDTFFMAGGLVTMYTFLKSCDKGVRFNLILYYIHRYLRLTPVLVIITLIHMYLLNYLGNGPTWNIVDSSLVEGCTDRWWGGLLYIQNYIKPLEFCVPQTWYLSVDMQLFVLSPLVLLPAKFWPKSLYPILCALIVGGIVTPFVVSYQYNLPPLITSLNSEAIEDYMQLYYIQTYARFGPYVVGMLFGALIYKIRSQTYVIRKSQKNLLISLVVWLIAMTGLVATLYSGASFLGADYDRVGVAFFNGLYRNAWAFALGLLIVLCVSGYGGPVNTFLSLPIFQLLTKVSYTMYLVHYMVITLRLSAVRIEGYFNNFNLMHAFWGDFMLTLVLSFLFCITFESPVITLEKYLLGGGRSAKKPEVSSPKENGNGTA